MPLIHADIYGIYRFVFLPFLWVCDMNRVKLELWGGLLFISRGWLSRSGAQASGIQSSVHYDETRAVTWLYSVMDDALEKPCLVDHFFFVQ